MESNPILLFLASDEDPSLKSFQEIATLVAECPLHLSDLGQTDLFDRLLDILRSKASRFTRILCHLGAEILGNDIYFRQITAFVQQLIRSTKDILDQSEYCDLLYAALRLSSADRDRWQIIAEITAYGSTLELLVCSTYENIQLLNCLLTLGEDGADPRALKEWTRRLIALAQSCSADHRLAKTLLTWQKIESLQHALHKAIYNKRGAIDLETSRLLVDLALPIPRSLRTCHDHMATLSMQGTLSILKQVLTSFPCRFCQHVIQFGLPPKIDFTTASIEGEEHSLRNDSSFLSDKGIGDWKVILSGRALKNLLSFRGNPQVKEILEKKLVDLAAGTARFSTLKFKERPKVPLRATKWHPDVYCIWQIDLAPGPELNEEQQVILVWTIGAQAVFGSMLDTIKSHQRTSSDERIRNCLDKGPLPKVYTDSRDAKESHIRARLDVRDVEPDFIDVAFKTVSVTPNALQFIMGQDLPGELPFNVSPAESQIIHYSETPTLIMGRSGTGKTTCLIYKMIALYAASGEAAPQRQMRQILITRSETLAEKLATYSRKLVNALPQNANHPRTPAFSEPLEQRSLFQLGHDDYPLICTYDSFLGMLENTIEMVTWRGLGNSRSSPTTKNLVTLAVFRDMYWEGFPSNLTAGLSPNLVFSEIMGVIKGSEDTCKTLQPLTMLEYQTRSPRLAPNVTASAIRLKVFKLYEIYENLKRNKKELDNVDRVIDILHGLREEQNIKSLIASCINQVYVDEVQDMTCVDIALLLSLGNDPRAFHLGGDTAQAISGESTFRFQNLSEPFRNAFQHQCTSIGQEQLWKPRMFTLNKNYRSHQGILEVASEIMNLLSMVFPATVDKLNPETGVMVGSSPIIFLRCGSSALVPRSAQDSNASDNELLFGAAHVILTRDDNGKAKLVEKIKGAALVLTILQAKGMEFDHVILFDFLSTTPDPSGWRSLKRSVEKDSGVFDTVKHAALCSELKHLYVAVTRARMRFSMVESSDETAEPFIDLMAQGSALPRLDVTTPDSKDFNEKLKALQPESSDDPLAWCERGEELMARGLYDYASSYFGKANEKEKAANAKARYWEVEGAKSEAKREGIASRRAFEKALSLYQDLDQFPDAARMMVRLGRVLDAALLWYRNGRYGLAGSYFEEALEFQLASDSWHMNHEFNKAATALHKGGLYDNLVVYLVDNQETLKEHEFIDHQNAMKSLLKERKMSANLRSPAIGLLGSELEQESCFLVYGMMDDLVELYKRQQANSKLLRLLVKLDRFEHALNLASSMHYQGEYVIGRPQLSRITAIAWVDRINATSPDRSKFSSKGGENRSWHDAFTILRMWNHSQSQQQILSMDDQSLTKIFLSLYVAIHLEKVVSPSTFSQIPHELLFYTLRLIKTARSEPSRAVSQAVFLLSGVTLDFPDKCSQREWSPLLHSKLNSRDGAFGAVVSWVSAQVDQALMRTHDLTRNMFQKTWPGWCGFFLMTGKCNNVGCPRLHQKVSTVNYAAFLEDLLDLNRFFCQITALYFRLVPPGEETRIIMGLRRHWLERLVSALSFVSGFEQDSLVLEKGFARLRTDQSSRIIVSCLEDYLLYKARKEWRSQANVGYVLEQLNLAGHLGRGTKHLLSRTTLNLLRNEKPSVFSTCCLLERLDEHIAHGRALQYHNVIQAYLFGSRGIVAWDWEEFAVFHCHTALFEAHALYLLLQISQSSVLIPRSWLDLHLPGILRRNPMTTTPTTGQLAMYCHALVSLLQSFTELLEWLEGPLKEGGKFYVCGRDYPTRLLQQRNAEVLAIILVNLLAVPHLCPTDIQERWQAVLHVFNLSTVKAWHLQHTLGNVNMLQSQLLKSFARYQGKNPLTILNITDAKPHPFSALERWNKLPCESLASLREILVPKKPIKVTTAAGSSAETDTEGAVVIGDEEAVWRIWKYWTKNAEVIKGRRAFANKKEGRMISKLWAMCNGSAFMVRFVLFYCGPEALDMLDFLGSSTLTLEERAFRTLDFAGTEHSVALNTVLEAVRKLSEGLKAHREHLSDESLEFIVRIGDHIMLKELLQNELKFMEGKMKKVVSLSEVLDGMVKGSE